MIAKEDKADSSFSFYFGIKTKHKIRIFKKHKIRLYTKHILI
jgi:hypothetical protein